MTQKELRLIYKEIKEFSSTSLSSGDKRKYNDDKLTRLGAPPIKAEKIPFKMKLGMMKHQKKLAVKELQHVKDSGVVFGVSKSKSLLNDKNKGNKRDNKYKDSKRVHVSSGDVGIERHHFKDGILRISNKFRK